MLNRGRRGLAVVVVLGALTAAEANAAVTQPRGVFEGAEPVPVRIERPAAGPASLPARVRKLVIRLLQELTPPVPAPRP